jgi:hypothetical protein
MGMMLLIAVVATILAFIQNWIMFAFGMKEMAILSFPFSFAGIFLLEISSIWAAYFCARKFLRRSRELVLAGCMVVILGAAELALPASYFTTAVQHARREHVLGQIALAGNSIEALDSDEGGTRFALTYTLRFPKTAHYLTFPAYLGPATNRVFGNYFTKLHPEYYDEGYVFEGGKPYSFTVVFDTRGKQFDFSKEMAKVDICDGKDYFMACRIIGIDLRDVPAALKVSVPPGRYEPEVPAGNVRDMTEKSIRLAGIRMLATTTTSGNPVRFSYDIKNVGSKDVPIPGSDFGNVMAVNYAWEAVSDSAKKTKVIPGIVHFGNAIAAGSAQLGFIKKSNLAAGENLTVHDQITPSESFAPGEYKLHVYLFSRYATEQNRPEQEIVQEFSVNP